MRTFKYGGQLSVGDFVAVAYSNYIDLGWYCGDGIGGTLQYYSFRSPGTALSQYEDWMNKTKNGREWLSRRYTNGFTKKCIYKSYINAVHATRVMKVGNPEELFTNQEDRDEYEKSKEALITLNFIKK